MERIGIDRAREELRGADVVLLVIDRSRPLGEEEKALLGQPGAPLVVALNKSDLDAVTTDAEVHKLSPQAKIVDTCAKTGEGVETLRQTLYETALRGASPEEAYLTNERHIQAARNAAEAIGRGAGGAEHAHTGLRGARSACCGRHLARLQGRIRPRILWIVFLLSSVWESE